MSQSKRKLLAFVGKPCEYCGKTMRYGKGLFQDWPTLEHVEPKSRFPVSQKIVVCGGCNNDKGDRFLLEWLEILSSKQDARAMRVKELIKKGF